MNISRPQSEDAAGHLCENQLLSTKIEGKCKKYEFIYKNGGVIYKNEKLTTKTKIHLQNAYYSAGK